MLYVFISLPIIIGLTTLILVFRSRLAMLFGLLLVAFWLIPVANLTSNAWDNLIIKTHWDWKNPWSKPLVWIWRHGDDAHIYPYTSFRYQWNQNYPTQNAKVLISCLGDYQLLVNGKSIYHGPSYAVPPRIYYDQVDIIENIKRGQNEITIVCNYSNEKHHQHVTYPAPGLLIGGNIKDGLITRNLADNRLWQTARNDGWANGERLSRDAGYAENLDLTIDKKWEIPQRLDTKKYTLESRPIPLLAQKTEPIDEMESGVYDLGRTTVGYLTASGNLDNDCHLSISWGDKLKPNQKVQGNSQYDKINFAKGENEWEQFSRRAGRYIQVEKKECGKALKFGFRSVGMPFVEPETPKFGQEIDTLIHKLGINTLRNNVQNHFEDSIIREKAMYIGDAREMSRCLMADGQNGFLVREMLKQFSQAQNKDGSLPAMAPSGNPVVIFDYVFQWIVWVNDYVEKSKDTVFAKELWPSIEKVLAWAEKHESPRGFVSNTPDTNWWIFIDWSQVDRSKQFVTALQIWYYRALRSAGLIAEKASLPGNKYLQKAEKLSTDIIQYSFNNKTGLFADSFSIDEPSKGENLATNALAGWSEIFPVGKSRAAVNKFGGKLITGVPFSESWVIEWLIKVDRKDLALKIIRDYWGGMVKDGATAIYETYTPGSSGEYTSYTHAWGCGPIYLYKEIF